MNNNILGFKAILISLFKITFSSLINKLINHECENRILSHLSSHS